MCGEGEYELSEVYIKPKKNIGIAIDEITAWHTLPEPYSPKSKATEENMEDISN